MAATLKTQIADAVSALFAAQDEAKVARSECERLMPVHSWTPDSPAFLDARERLRAANSSVSAALARRNDLIRALEVA